MKPKTGEIKFKGLGRVVIKPIRTKKVMKCRQGFLKGLMSQFAKQ
jgi:hypothetical protein